MANVVEKNSIEGEDEGSPDYHKDTNNVRKGVSTSDKNAQATIKNKTGGSEESTAAFEDGTNTIDAGETKTVYSNSNEGMVTQQLIESDNPNLTLILEVDGDEDFAEDARDLVRRGHMGGDGSFRTTCVQYDKRNDEYTILSSTRQEVDSEIKVKAKLPSGESTTTVKYAKVNFNEYDGGGNADEQ